MKFSEISNGTTQTKFKWETLGTSPERRSALAKCKQTTHLMTEPVQSPACRRRRTAPDCSRSSPRYSCTPTALRCTSSSVRRPDKRAPVCSGTRSSPCWPSARWAGSWSCSPRSQRCTGSGSVHGPSRSPATECRWWRCCGWSRRACCCPANARRPPVRPNCTVRCSCRSRRCTSRCFAVQWTRPYSRSDCSPPRSRRAPSPSRWRCPDDECCKLPVCGEGKRKWISCYVNETCCGRVVER